MNFKEQMTTDLDVFINPDEFGESVIYSQGGVDKEINVLFSEVPDENSNFKGMLTIMTLKRSDAPGLDKTALFIRGTRRYTFVDKPKNYDTNDLPLLVMTEV